MLNFELSNGIGQIMKVELNEKTFKPEREQVLESSFSNLQLHEVCNFYNIKTIGYSGPDARGLLRTQTYSIGLCTVEASLVKFVCSSLLSVKRIF